MLETCPSVTVLTGGRAFKRWGQEEMGIALRRDGNGSGPEGQDWVPGEQVIIKQVWLSQLAPSCNATCHGNDTAEAPSMSRLLM